MLEEAVAGGHVAIPAIQIVALRASRIAMIVLEHEDPTGHYVPEGAVGGERSFKPILLCVVGPQDSVAMSLAVLVDDGVPKAVFAGHEFVAAGLDAAVLADVEHAELSEPSVGDLAVEVYVPPLLPGQHPGGPQGHVLVIGLVGGGSTPSESWLVVPGVCAGVVVFHLMVVPGNHPGVRPWAACRSGSVLYSACRLRKLARS